ncbi:MAG TPA: hypothetical protein VGG61_02745 [Gemmataceae bacterium]|jgi:hypothetical protein
MRNALKGVLAFGFLLASVATSPGAETDALLKTIKNVGGEGDGNVAAAKAWAELVKAGPAALIDILAAFEGADVTAVNYLRTAAETIAEREGNAGRALPAAKLEAFLNDKKHSGKARRLAYDLLVRVDAKAPERLLPGMLDDPAGELRRDAVAVALKDAQAVLEKGDKAAAATAFWKVLSSARDKDQIDLIAKQIKALGGEVDLAAKFGFIRHWALACPFDNTEGAGFAKVFPPEKGVDLTATYTGKKDAKAQWIKHATTDDYGTVNLNKVLGKLRGTTAYAFTVIDSPDERPVELRAGSITALKIFLNGKQMFAREEYHHGMDMDQHVGTGTLKKGRNEILVKICQNEQTEQWAQEWMFQLRVCDALGGAVPMTVVEPSILSDKPETRRRP